MPQIRRAGYLLSALLAAALLTSMMWKPKPPPQFHAIATSVVPMRLGAYTGDDVALDEGTREALQSAQTIDRNYTSADGGLVSFALIGGADRDALHDPRSCLVGAGGRIDSDRVETLPGSNMKVRACNAVFAGGDGAQETDDTVFFYVTKSGIVSDATQIRAKLLLTAFEQRGEPVFFMRFMAPVSSSAPDSVRRETHKRVMAFAAAMWAKTGDVLTKAAQQ